MSLSPEAHAAIDTFQKAVASTRSAFELLRVNFTASVTRLDGIVESLIAQLKSSDSLLVPILGGGAGPSSPAHTTVNVSILSLRIGMELDYAHPDLSQLGQVAMLRDIHRVGTRASDRRGSGAHEHVEIVDLAAAYESFSRQQTKGPRAWPPVAVKEILRRERGRSPDALLKALIQISVSFPVGGLVRLNSGEIACVVAKNEGLPLRPVVTIRARHGRLPAEPKVIDLRQSPFLYVREFLGFEAPESGPEDRSS